MTLPKDKLLHFAGCAVLTSALVSFAPDWAAVTAVLGVGFGKELWDSREGGTGFSWGDIAADMYGIAVGLWMRW